ncbi:MAG TPA: hypothetical protein VM140_14250 [Burkholderiales bacterium]|nr:hypothetical protein [Burkholderiales bacterium]
MTTLRVLLVAFLLACGQAHAQGAASSEEISFWETVRDSKNAAELQAYLDQYPNGRFAVLARARLAALNQKPPAQPAAPPRPQAAPVVAVPLAILPAGSRMPQVGDTWTYRLAYVKRWGAPLPTPSVRTHVVRVDSASESEIVDHVLVDGEAASSAKHAMGSYFVTQGVSVFAPYLVDFSDLSRAARLANVSVFDGACRSTHACSASARVVGTETVQVAAGSFNAIRIVVEQNWRPGPGANALGQFQMAQMNGGRTLHIWYVPQVKRAVKISSRHTVGDVTPVDTHFDLELVSYQVK